MCESSLILRVGGAGWGSGWGSGGSRPRRHALGAAPTRVSIEFPAVYPQTPPTAKISLCSVSVVGGGGGGGGGWYPWRRYQLVPAHETAQKQNQHFNVPEGCSFS